MKMARSKYGKENVKSTLEGLVQDQQTQEDEHTEPLVEVQNLTVCFRSPKGFLDGKNEEVRAVDGIDLTIQKGKTLGLVGESGCGKTQLGVQFCT